MTAPVGPPEFFADLSGLAALKSRAQQDPQALREAARQFESLFARMLLQSMRAASFGDALLQSDQQDFYRGMFDDQLAVELTRGRGLGLADMLVEQLTRAGVAPGATADVALQAHAPAAGAPGATGSPWRNASREDFVQGLWPHAEQAAAQLGVDPRLLVAHAALETGWGRALPCAPDGRCSFNLFGIKATGGWSGATVSARTLEVEGGIAVQRQERFRAYESAAASFADYVALLRDNPRYAAVRDSGSDPEAFATALQRAGYATDPDYAEKLQAVARSLAEMHSAGRLKIAAARPITAASTAV